ncbi:MAG: SDR family oxidoreductase [Phycisphaerae bacterium]|nr:SDR family oxidoreductase [Gemmatimonadaceae bacterium]
MRSAVVTGASRGIGRAVAELLVRDGVRVYMLARTASQLDEAAQVLGQLAVPVVCDVTDPQAVARAVTQIGEATGGAPDILINNAGIFPLGSMHLLDAADLERTLAVNVVSPFRFVRAFIATMKQRGSGMIITIGSVADRAIFSENGAYAASKHAQRAMHEVLRQELTGTGVRASLVSPGPTDTNIWDAIDPDSREGFPKRAQMLSAGAVAAAIRWVISAPLELNVDELRLSRA